jgi:hypothetical protein
LYLSYTKFTWWIDSGATIHVANSLQGFYTRRTLQRGERHIKVANGVKAKVQATGELSLKLNNGFVLKLSDVLYVPSLRRNLISGNGQCKILFNNKCVCLAFRQDKLYLLPLSKNMNVVSTENENASSSINVSKKRKRIHDVSSKLWHCRLGHISRRIE